MNIAKFLHPLLGQYSIEVAAGASWAVARDYAKGCATAEIERLATALDSLAEAPCSDAELLDALIDVGCYYWSGDNEGIRTWLSTLAHCLRAEVSERSLSAH